MRAWFSLPLILSLFFQLPAIAAELHHALPHEALLNHHARTSAARKLFPHVFREKLADVASFKSRYSGELQALVHRNSELGAAIANLKSEDVFFAVSRKSSKSGLFVRLNDAQGQSHVFLINSGVGTTLPQKVEASRFNHDAHGTHFDTQDKRVLVVGKDGKVRVRNRNLWERFKSLFAFFKKRSSEHQAKPFFTANDMHLHRRADSAQETSGYFPGWFSRKSVIRKDGTMDNGRFMKRYKNELRDMYGFAKMEFQAAGKRLEAHEFINRSTLQIGTYTDTNGLRRSTPFVTIEHDGVSLAFAVAEQKGLFAKSDRNWDFPQFLPIAHGGSIELAGGDRLVVSPGKGYEWHDGPAYASGSGNRKIYALSDRDPIRQGNHVYYSYDRGYYNDFWFYMWLTDWDPYYHHHHYWHHHSHYYDYDYYHYDYGHYGDRWHDTTVINNDSSIHNTTIHQSVDMPAVGPTADFGMTDTVAPPLEVPGSDLQVDMSDAFTADYGPKLEVSAPSDSSSTMSFDSGSWSDSGSSDSWSSGSDAMDFGSSDSSH